MSLSYLKSLHDSPCAQDQAKSGVRHGSKLSPPPTSPAALPTILVLEALQTAWARGTALSSPSAPGCFSSRCVGPFRPLCLEFLPKPLPQPPPLPILLHRFRLSLGDLFSRSQPQLGRKPLFACVSLSLHHRPVRECSVV